MWIYEQKTGALRLNDNIVAKGYSGHGDGKNNPEAESIHNVGPIPRGNWRISGPPVDTSTHGPFVLHLMALPETETFGRSGFLIHGDSMEHPGAASEGCVILARSVREYVWTSNDRNLKII
jgi:hypothetical protein